MTITLSDLLARYTVPNLKDFLEHIPGSNKSGRKEDLIARLLDAMSGPDLQSHFSRLDALQQAAVAEAVHHPLGQYSGQRFLAKYQALPAFETSSKPAHLYGGQMPSALALFIHKVHDLSCQMIPSDLRARLKQFVPRPATVVMKNTEQAPSKEDLTVRMTEREALQEVMIMLRTIEQGRVQVSEKTLLAGTATLRLITEKLVGGDFYPWPEKKDKWEQQIGPIKAFAWPLLVQAGGLARLSGNRLVLTPQGIKALSAPPANVLCSLWRAWLKSTILDEFSRIDAIKGQNAKGRVMTAVTPRRATIEAVLRDCPVGRWIELNEFSRFMRATDRLFAVTHDVWKLYIGDREYGSLAYMGSNEWNILQDRYISALLFEYAATLGLIDIAYVDPVDGRDGFSTLWGADELAFLSRYDGLDSIRVTPLGAYVLGLTTDYQPVAVPSTVSLSVLPSLQIKVTRGTLAIDESLLLENWAEQLSPDSWLLNKAKTLSSIEKGFDIAELQGFLESRDEMPLPDSVESFIRQSERNGRALKVAGNVVLVECRDAEIADAIAAHKETGSLCQRTGTKGLVVPANQLDKLRERVHLLGFGLVA